jgi:hypothetical protein
MEKDFKKKFSKWKTIELKGGDKRIYSNIKMI